jgi:hypothetical protein
MRNRKHTLLLALLALLVGAAGCDVTTEPKSTVTDSNIYSDPSSYEQLLAKIYAGLAVTGQQGPAGQGDILGFDEGFSHYLRILWEANELPTDEAVIAWNDGSIQELHTMLWSTTNGFMTALYYRVYFQVALANEFLRQTTDEALTSNGHADLIDDAVQWRAEARFLRALSYWHGLDLFGDIPLVDENFPIGPIPPEQATAQAIYDFIVSELNEIRSDLPPAGAGDYGRADQGALAMLLAKVYMNAEVYTGSAAWGSAMSEVENVLAGPYQLADDYFLNFRADNHTSPEIIFPVPQDGDATQTWGGTTFLVHAGCGNDRQSEFGVDFCWAGLRVQPEFVALFPGAPANADGRAVFYTEGKNLSINSLTEYNDGYAVDKWSNLTSSGTQGSNPTHVDTDYPMFRLADAYLMYAELALRGGGGSTATAVGYINDLRERAYGDATGNISAGDLTLDFILDERSRELYWEGHRRMDLLRYGLYTGNGYLWEWKGGSQAGSPTDEFKALFPLPASELSSNPNLTQNPGY